ncbi:MAG: magnesium chelatase subunit D [Caldimonas sp.]
MTASVPLAGLDAALSWMARVASAPVLPAASLQAAALFAVDPVGLGGVLLRSSAGPLRQGWLDRVAALLPLGVPWQRVPLHVSDERLLGGLDLSATLQAGRPVAQRGLLASADGGVVLLSMAERIGAGTAARITAVLDSGHCVVERDGLTLPLPSRFGVIALDEGLDDDERTPRALQDRLAFHVGLDFANVAKRADAERARDTANTAEDDVVPPGRIDIEAARAVLPDVAAPDEIVEALCAAAVALGIGSLRAPVLALRAARAAAALAGRREVGVEDAALAARLVLGPRATVLPVPPAADDAMDAATPDDATEPTDDSVPPSPHDQGAADSSAVASDPDPRPDPAGGDESSNTDAARDPAAPLNEVVLEAAVAAIPADLLATLQMPTNASRAASVGRSGALNASRLRGRPIGARRGVPGSGARLALLATLRAAAPWQRVRRAAGTAPDGRPATIAVRREDFHITRYQQRSETTTVFVVDASGSSALHRLAEAKGAVELLLADCYVRRDSVAVIAFRDRRAEVLLPPTRSLVRARRSLAGLPGGGGTPLAAGIDAAAALAEAIRRRGATPVVVLLTDGRANIARDGSPGRVQAHADALAAAHRLRALGAATLLIDTSAQPQEPAQRLAEAMRARYVPLPHAGAQALSRSVREAATQTASSRQPATRSPARRALTERA